MSRTLTRLVAVLGVVTLAACMEDTPTTGVANAAAASQDDNGRTFVQIERLGNPLVSEALIVKARHELHNFGQPSTDVANHTGDIVTFVTQVAGRDQAYANGIAAALLPDMLLTYPKRDGKPVFWLSWAFGGYGGRTLADDAVDIGLGAVFGNLLGNNNNVTAGLSTDNVPANDKVFRTSFPYLAPAS